MWVSRRSKIKIIIIEMAHSVVRFYQCCQIFLPTHQCYIKINTYVNLADFGNNENKQHKLNNIKL